MSAVLDSLFDRAVLPNDTGLTHLESCTAPNKDACPLCAHLCVRCGRPAGSEALDECLGCTTKRLCPPCMIAHDCGIRAAQKGLAHK